MTNIEKRVEELTSDRKKFTEFVYTPVQDAVIELEKRRKDPALNEFVNSNLPAGAPLIMKDKSCAVLFRQVATPNYELRRFISLVDGLEQFTPLFFEYTDDKYTDNNEVKYHLGKLPFFHGRGKKGGEKITRLNIIDFQTSRGKPIKDVKTLWGQDLTEFHHQLFDEAFGNKIKETLFFDASGWFSSSGKQAKNYYKHFLTLFLKDAILFENFIMDGKEADFTREVFLPALLEITHVSGYKPLIVALTPTEVESNIFWFCHPGENYNEIQSKIKPI